MSKIKYVKIQNTDGGFSSNLPIGADAINVDLQGGNDVQHAMQAVENDINRLDARIDQVSSVPSEETEGNAQLLDIRIGVDGTEYSSAGTAVRQQVKQITRAKAVLDENNIYDIKSYRLDIETETSNPEVIVDPSLSINGAAADAKATGDIISALGFGKNSQDLLIIV